MRRVCFMSGRDGSRLLNFILCFCKLVLCGRQEAFSFTSNSRSHMFDSIFLQPFSKSIMSFSGYFCAWASSDCRMYFLGILPMAEAGGKFKFMILGEVLNLGLYRERLFTLLQDFELCGLDFGAKIQEFEHACLFENKIANYSHQ